ncbi:TPA: crosslink repair DNA glycosylase YcaQ family protein [Bacillus cereus]
MNQISHQLMINLNLYKQYLYTPTNFSQKNDIEKILKQVVCIQLDTINVLTRAHNLFFFSRMETYKPEWFYDLYEEKKVFEAYLHALSLCHKDFYPYIKPVFREFKEKMMEDEENIDFLLDIYNQVKNKQLLDSSGIQSRKDKRELETWEITPDRWALNHLWRSGLLGVLRNQSFRKKYTPIENIISPLCLQKEIDTKLINQQLILSSLEAMGIATMSEIKNYLRVKKQDVEESINKLIINKKVFKVIVHGFSEDHYISYKDYDLISSGFLNDTPQSCTFLSPFDNLIWDRERTLKLFTVDYRLESYIPSEHRKYGYYALPILIQGRIVGTIDLKLNRKEKTLLIKKLNIFNKFEEESLSNYVLQIIEKILLVLGISNVKMEESNQFENKFLAKYL